MKALKSSIWFVCILCLVLIGAQSAMAGVSAEEAQKLKTTLTPLGAEKAGNADGTIPAWDGGYTKTTPGVTLIPDPFADEKRLFSITAQNMDQYADKLSDGVKAMLQKHPDTFRVDVYPTHRTHFAPQWVYDNTFKNATRGTLEGQMPKNVYGGIPFPIPKNGTEAIWNHQLLWRGVGYIRDARAYLITTAGKKVMMEDNLITTNFPYYYEDGSVETFKGNFLYEKATNTGPPIRTGEGIMGHGHLDPDKYLTYIYLTGQRRVRKLPEGCCDTPTPFSSGQITFDEIDLFVGGLLSMRRFDWKLLGKKEMYVPYNSNRTAFVPRTELFGDHFLNPDHVRWELHRVWMVECTLRDGHRHTSPRSIYYLDEDHWGAVLADRWDADNQLWRTLFRITYVIPKLQSAHPGTFGYYDLVGGASYIAGIFNEEKTPFKVVGRMPARTFSPQSLAGRGVR